MSSIHLLASTTLPGRLFGVSATSPTSAWAVGDQISTPGNDRTLILHWNGTAWSKVASPNPSTSFNTLRGVKAISATNAWAVGNYTTATGAQLTLILHWNGSAWSKVASPNPSTRTNLLNGVSAASPTNAWAVGGYCASTCSSSQPLFDPLILHWNGITWSEVASPSSPNGLPALRGVSAISGTSAWAAGSSLILRWNGTIWSKVASPNPSTGANDLRSVSANSATNTWAVGARISTTGNERTLILRWNGTTWSKVASPNPSTSLNMLLGVSGASPTGAWAVGGYCALGCTGLDPVYDTLILRWNGTAWSKVASPPAPSAFQPSLWGVSTTSSTSAWAVGYRASSTGEFTLILHWNGTTWSQA